MFLAAWTLAHQRLHDSWARCLDVWNTPTAHVDVTCSGLQTALLGLKPPASIPGDGQRVACCPCHSPHHSKRCCRHHGHRHSRCPHVHRLLTPAWHAWPVQVFLSSPGWVSTLSQVHPQPACAWMQRQHAPRFLCQYLPRCSRLVHSRAGNFAVHALTKDPVDEQFATYMCLGGRCSHLPETASWSIFASRSPRVEQLIQAWNWLVFQLCKTARSFKTRHLRHPACMSIIAATQHCRIPRMMSILCSD